MISSIGRLLINATNSVRASAGTAVAATAIAAGVAGGAALFMTIGVDDSTAPAQIALDLTGQELAPPPDPRIDRPTAPSTLPSTAKDDVVTEPGTQALGEAATPELAKGIPSTSVLPSASSSTTLASPTVSTTPTAPELPTTSSTTAVTTPSSSVQPGPNPTTPQTPPPTTTQSQQPTDTQTRADVDAMFVSTSGNDSNAGSSAQPFRTIDRAISQAPAGTTIIVSTGTYDPVTIRNRTDLTIQASGQVTITSGRYDQGAGFLIDSSTQIRLDGFRIVESLWGIRVLGSDAIEISNNYVGDIGQEAVSVKYLSHDVTIANNTIENTGKRPGSDAHYEYSVYGEGIYLGSGGNMPDGQPDTVHDVRIIGNDISSVTSEAIDVKASVSDVVIRGNSIHDLDLHSGGAISMGRGTRDFDGNHVVESNAIWNIGTYSQWSDGVAIRVSTTATVRNNVIWNTQHDGILVDNQLRSAANDEVIIENNLVLNPGQSAVDIHYSGPVQVTVTGTVEGSAADSLLAQYGQTPADIVAGPLISHLEAG